MENKEDLEIIDRLQLQLEEEAQDFNGFTTAGSLACAASFIGGTLSSGSSFSSAGD
ncbi:thiocillin family RiPP [Staphylococcus pseudintermedius]|nr:thiocillin family RiPP [Staphylococcus pseudintermedius]